MDEAYDPSATLNSTGKRCGAESRAREISAR
jgi:hypothetical protein